LDANQIGNVLVRNLIGRQSFSISDSGLVIVTYDNKSELHEFQKIENELVKFFQFANFHITGFDYEFNHDRQQIEADKKVREEKMFSKLNPINTTENELKKVEVYNLQIFNKFKDRQVKLADIVFGGDNQYAIVSGEIFKIKSDQLKSGNQKFTFYITDYEDTFVITTFVGVRKANYQ
jgi:DNA polymerase III alpha subunit (gram-positive type)